MWDKEADYIRQRILGEIFLLHQILDKPFRNELDHITEHPVSLANVQEYITAELKKSLPNHHCNHAKLWSERCSICEKVGPEAVKLDTEYDKNLLMSRIGQGKWEGYSKLISYKGSTTNEGKLTQIDAASQRDKKLGGRRGKPKGIGADSDDSRKDIANAGGVNTAGTQISSAIDPNYSGKKIGPDYAGAAKKSVERADAKEPEFLPSTVGMNKSNDLRTVIDPDNLFDRPEIDAELTPWRLETDQDLLGTGD